MPRGFGPAQERRVRRTIRGKHRLSAPDAGQGANDTLGPPVKRVYGTVACLIRSLKQGPKARLIWAKQHHTADVRRKPIVLFRIEHAAQRQPLCARRAVQVLWRHGWGTKGGNSAIRIINLQQFLMVQTHALDDRLTVARDGAAFVLAHRATGPSCYLAFGFQLYGGKSS